jgi:hypothetical protein
MLTGLASYERQAEAIARELRLLRQDAEPAPSSTAVELASDLGLSLDLWQREALTTSAQDILLLCSRQAGKSTVAGLLALHQAVTTPDSLVLVVSPSERQSKRLLRTVRRQYDAVRAMAPAVTEGMLAIELRNGSEIHALPGREGTIRGFSKVDLLIIDEAARVDDNLYAAIRPMLALSRGKLIALTTPFGRRGFFYREWTEGGLGWHRAKVTAWDCPRISHDWLEHERARIGSWWFEQEFECEFKDATDQFFGTNYVQAALSEDVVSLNLPSFGRSAT